MESQWSDFYSFNFKRSLYVYDLGDHEKLDAYNKPILSMFMQNNQKLLISDRSPKLSHCDLLSSDRDN